MAYLVDITKVARAEKRRKTLMYLDFASRVTLFEPNTRLINHIIEDSHWKWWRYSEIPHFSELKTNYKSLKFFIKRFYTSHPKIWNPSFILGVSESGLIDHSLRSSITFDFNSLTIYNIFTKSPFPFQTKVVSSPYTLYCKNITIFNMEKSKDNLSYMAGVFAAGFIKLINGVKYIAYSNKIKPIFDKWRIPIEHKDRSKIYINPFWPAMLEDYMPDFARIYSNINIKKESIEKNKAIEYAAILWRAYCPNLDSVINIPFLLSRRGIYKKFTSETLSTSRFLEDLRFKYKLMNLDSRFKDLIHYKTLVKDYRTIKPKEL